MSERKLSFREASVEKSFAQDRLREKSVNPVITICHEIRRQDRLTDIPIVMVTAVTAVTEMKELQLAFTAGAVDYIRKPVNKIELLARVRPVLKLKHEMYRRQARGKEERLELTRQL